MILWGKVTNRNVTVSNSWQWWLGLAEGMYCIHKERKHFINPMNAKSFIWTNCPSNTQWILATSASWLSPAAQDSLPQRILTTLKTASQKNLLSVSCLGVGVVQKKSPCYNAHRETQPGDLKLLKMVFTHNPHIF